MYHGVLLSCSLYPAIGELLCLARISKLVWLSNLPNQTKDSKLDTAA